MTPGDIILSKYKILSIIKDTKEVSVYLAEHINLNSYWIIKKLNNDNTALRREIEVLKGLKHKGIPLIVDVVYEEASTIIIREYMQGVTLEEYVLEHGTLSEEMTIQIGIKLCEILSYLHEDSHMPLIYRDLKPSNIILTPSHEVKLIDFGIARFYKDSKCKDTEYLGTKGFAAPEQYGFGQSDIRTDVFGVGSTLYYLLTLNDLGKPPYQHRSISQYRKDIEKNFEKILIKACKLNKEERFESINQLQEALETLVKKPIEKDITDLLKNFDGLIIGFVGLSNGCGVSHLTLVLAHILARRGKQVAIVDESEKQALQLLEYHPDGSFVGDVLTYHTISIFNKESLQGKGQLWKENSFEGIDAVVIDFGTRMSKVAAYGISNLFIIAGSNPWEIDIFEEFVMNQQKEAYFYLINFASEKTFLNLRNSIKELILYHVPILAYDIDRLEGYDCFFDIIFQERGWKELCHGIKKEHLFSKVVNFKERFQQNIRR